MTTTVRAPYAHLTGPDRDAARARAAGLYSQGATIHSVAREIGGSYWLARTLLREAKVTLRGRGSGARKAAG